MNALRLALVALVVIACSSPASAAPAAAAVDWRDERIYMLMTDRFRNGDPTNDSDADATRANWWHGGDLQGVIDELGYIKGLGMSAIWITPVVTQMPGGYHGYWTRDLYTIDPHLGDMSKLRELTAKAHALDLKIVLDVVLNHVGQGNPWLTDGAHQDWFHDDCVINFADQLSVERCWLAGLPDFNTENPAVRKYLIDWAMWMIDESGVDGFRIDAARHMSKDFLGDLTATIKAKHPSFWLLGEIFSSGYHYQSGYLAAGLDAVTDFQTYESVGIALAKNGNLSQLTLPPGLAADLGAGREELRTTFIDNHDVARFVGADPPDADARARLAEALAYLYTAPGTPVLYYGTEIALPGGRDPDDRRSMPWTGTDAVTRDLVKTLASLRADTPALRRGSFIELLSERASAAFARVLGDTRVVVAFNGGEPRDVRVPLAPLGVSAVSGLSVFAGPAARVEGTDLVATMPARGYGIWSVAAAVAAPARDGIAIAAVLGAALVVAVITAWLSRRRLRSARA